MTAHALEDAKELAAMYSTLPDAVAELERRRQDPELAKKVAKYLTGFEHHINTTGEPYFCYSRHITSANYEFQEFWNMAGEYPQYPIYLLEGSTKFVPQNTEKYHLAKLFFCRENPPTDNDDFRQPTITYRSCEFNDWYGKPMHNIPTFGGEMLVDLHHRVLLGEYPELPQRAKFIGGYYPWLLQTREAYAHRYTAFFASFIMNGILFESDDFLGDEEDRVIHSQIIPSYKDVYEHFGLKPLIVVIVDPKKSHSDYWLWYNTDLIEKYDLKNALSPNNR